MAGGIVPLSQAQVKVDANGALVVALDGSSPVTATEVTATDAFILGAATTSGIRMDLEAGTLAVREGDDSAYGPMKANVFTANSHVVAGYGSLGNVTVGAANDNISFPVGGALVWSTTRGRITSPADGQVNVTNAAITAGVGVDVATDGIFKVRTRAQTADAQLQASAVRLPNGGTAPTAGEVTLTTGAATISTTAIGASDVVLLSRKTAGGTVGTLTYTISAGTSFTISSSTVLDTSVVAWAMIKVF